MHDLLPDGGPFGLDAGGERWDDRRGGGAARLPAVRGGDSGGDAGRAERDVLPAGPLAINDGVTLKFTGKERDSETGLDWFETRYLSSAQGRFASPDEIFANWDQHDPQSFNLYTYVENNPLNRIDVDGRNVQVCVLASDQKSYSCWVMTDQEYAKTYKNQNGKNGVAMPRPAGVATGGAITCGERVCGFAMFTDPGGSIGTDTLGAILDFGALRGLGRLGELGTEGLAGLFRRDARSVIGKMGDLKVPGAIRSGEQALVDDLIDLGGPKANWAQNSSRLREVMARGKPIRDASAEPLENGMPARNTGFLRAERNVLENHGWTYHDGYWYPPK